jgi:hypothetical protein
MAQSLLQVLQHLRRLGHTLIAAADFDEVVSGGNPHVKGGADYAEVAVRRAVKSAPSRGIFNRDGDFQTALSILPAIPAGRSDR